MKQVRTALNLGEKMNLIYPQVLTFFIHTCKTSNLDISRCSFAEDRKEMDKSEKRAERAKLLFLPTKYD